MKSFLCLLALSASAMLTLSSCAGFDIPSVPHQVAFHEAEFARYGGSGTGTVQGHISVMGEDDHEFHPGDQTELTLLPVTSYTAEIVNREIGHGQYLSKSDPRLRQYLRFTTAGPRGEFVIPNVPAGDYYLSGLVEWSFAGEFQYQWACEKIHVSPGQTVQVQVSRNMHAPGERNYLVVSRLE